MHTHYQLCDTKGAQIVAVLDPSCVECIKGCSTESEVTSSCKGVKVRRGKSQASGGTAFLCTSDVDQVKSTKVFKKNLLFYSSMIPIYAEVRDDIAKREFEKTSNLLHNLIKFNALELQELYALIPQDELVKSFRDQVEMVEGIVKRDPKESAGVFLRLLKNSVSVKNEFAVYQKLYDTSPTLNFAAHYVHKVILNVAHLFYQGMLENSLRIRVDACADRLSLDYESFQVALYHLLDNAVKYAESGTEIAFTFERSNSGIRICLTMESLAISPEELGELYRSGFSGQQAVLAKTAGKGVGMGIVRTLLGLNYATLTIKPGHPRSPKATLAGKTLRYATNIFAIDLATKSMVPSAGAAAPSHTTVIKPSGYR